MKRNYHFLLLFSLVLVIQGCARTMMQPPAIVNLGIQQEVFAGLPPELSSTTMDVLYITDRLKTINQVGQPEYGTERSPAASYGVVNVEAGNDLSWEHLVNYSLGKEGYTGKLPIHLNAIKEVGVFPATPYLFEIVDGWKVEPTQDVVEELDAAYSKARKLLLEKLALSPRKEVIITVHGVATGFESHVMNLAEFWHHMGREMVPIAYTWPAGSGGLFFYAKDRESGEFTILHLKQVLRFLGDMPEIEKIHILSHSRGTDVVMTALRELVIESRARGIDPRKQYRIENVVLAAADLDIEVSAQRIAGEALGPAFGHTTIYTNLKDNAIAASKKLFQSRLRLGALEPEKLSPLQLELIQRSVNLDIILYEGSRGGIFQHGYYADPQVSSDLIMLLRNGWKAGEHGRENLLPMGPNLWKLRSGRSDSQQSR